MALVPLDIRVPLDVLFPDGSPVYARLEFSRDDLSVTSPTYFDVSSYLRAATWSDGKSDDLGEPQAGSATFVFKNTDRRWEPEFAAGAYYPDITPLKRFRLSVDADGVTYDEGIWYARSYDVVYPDPKANYSEVVVECVDGFGLLSLDALEAMDPPEAESYEEVVNYDNPSFYYRLGEPEGTKLVSHVRKHKRHGKTIKRRWKTRETRAEVEGQSGPSGTYKNLPTLGVTPGLILGDLTSFVAFSAASFNHARIALDASDLIDRNRLTVECWASFGGPMSDTGFVGGPYSTPVTDSVFWLGLLGGTPGNARCKLYFTNGASLTLTSGTSGGDYFAFTWSGTTAILYRNGVEVARGTAEGDLRTGDANDYLYIGRTGAGNYMEGGLQEVAVYEKALEPATIMRHYVAGSQRGYDQQTAGSRISSVVTSDLWSETNIPAGTFDVVPRFKHGQAKIEEIMDTVRAEMPANHFYFNGEGDPVYKPWNYNDGLAVSATIGDGGGSEVAYSDCSLVYDDEIFNEVTTSTEEGPAQVASDADSQSVYRRRAAAETSLMLVDDADAAAVGDAILERFKDPHFRLEQVSLNGATAVRRAQILGRQIGDMIRFKRRQGGGTAIDIVTPILGRSKTVDVAGNIYCTWNTGRGFNAADGDWQLGISGFTELNTTAVLA